MHTTLSGVKLNSQTILGDGYVVYSHFQQYYSYTVAVNNITVISWRSTILQLHRGGQQYYSYIVAVNNITVISWRSTILQLYRGGHQYYSYIVAVNNITAIS